MGELARFGVSLDESLLREFDRFIQEKGYKNRSQAIAHLIADCLKERLLMNELETAMGILTLVYDHEKRELVDTLIELQHKYLSEVIASLHIHLSKHDCVEIIVVKGKVKDLRTIEKEIVTIKGVKQGQLQVIAKSE